MKDIGESLQLLEGSPKDLLSLAGPRVKGKSCVRFVD